MHLYQERGCLPQLGCKDLTKCVGFLLTPLTAESVNFIHLEEGKSHVALPFPGHPIQKITLRAADPPAAAAAASTSLQPSTQEVWLRTGAVATELMSALTELDWRPGTSLASERYDGRTQECCRVGALAEELCSLLLELGWQDPSQEVRLQPL